MEDAHQVAGATRIEPTGGLETLRAVAIQAVIVIVIEGAELGASVIRQRVTCRRRQLILELAQQMQREIFPFSAYGKGIVAGIRDISLEVLEDNAQLVESRGGESMQLVQANEEVASQIAKALLVLQPAPLEADIVRGSLHDHRPAIALAGHIEGFTFGRQLQLQNALDCQIGLQTARRLLLPATGSAAED